MSKRLAGRRLFEAMGRSHEALGISTASTREQRQGWPFWARKAYFKGRLHETRTSPMCDRLVNSMATLQACNDWVP